MAEVFVVRERIEGLEKRVNEIYNPSEIKDFCKKEALEALKEETENAKDKIRVSGSIARANIEGIAYSTDASLAAINEKLQWSLTEARAEIVKQNSQIKNSLLMSRVAVAVSLGFVVCEFLKLIIFAL